MKLGVPFLQFPLLFDAAALAAEVQAIDESAWRPHPAGYAGNDALLLVTVGGDPNSDATSGPMSATEHLRRCPYLMQVLESIGGTWGRSRLMRLSGRAEVTSHVDINYYWRERARVHVPIVTQPTVRFVCGEAEVNMRAGECWIFDTWAEHNVINDHYLSRIHLVADTVGGAGFWEHVRNARPHQAEIPGWQPRACPPVAGYVPELDYEAENFPTVMTPWEIRSHYAFLMGESTAHPAVPLIHQALLQFSRHWQALWARYGERPDGWARYRDAIEAAKADLAACGAESVDLRNGVRLMEALQAWVFEPALAAHRRTVDADIRQRAGQATAVLPDSASTSGSLRGDPSGARSRVRPARLHRLPAAIRFDAAVRNHGAVTGRVHDRRRKPPAHRRRAHAGARGARFRVQPSRGCGCHARGRRRTAPQFLRGPARSCPAATGCGQARADAREDPEERVAGAVPRPRFPGSALHLPASGSHGPCSPA